MGLLPSLAEENSDLLESVDSQGSELRHVSRKEKALLVSAFCWGFYSVFAEENLLTGNHFSLLYPGSFNSCSLFYEIPRKKSHI